MDGGRLVNHSDTSTLERIRDLAQELQGARTARQRYEISKEINNLSKHAQAARFDPRPPLKMNKDRWGHGTRVEYDRKADIFCLYALPKEPADQVYYVQDDDGLLLVARGTYQIVGFQVDHFRSEWLKKHPELDTKAQKAKTPIAYPLLRRFSSAWADFTAAVVKVIQGTSGAPPRMHQPS